MRAECSFTHLGASPVQSSQISSETYDWSVPIPKIRSITKHITAQSQYIT